MKQIILSIMFCMLLMQGFASVPPYYPGVQIQFTVSMIYDDPVVVKHPHPKSPTESPIVYLDAHTLYLCGEHSGFTLVLKDTDETEVFSTNIPENTYTVVLPSTLSGDYTIELWDDTYVFSGDIEL